MITKREVLKAFAETGNCSENLNCSECPYRQRCFKLLAVIRKIGARKLLKMFPKKREFDTDKILTCITADKAKVGMRGYFGDTITLLKERFQDKPHLLTEIRDEDFAHRFVNENNTNFSLFYPIEEVEE